MSNDNDNGMLETKMESIISRIESDNTINDESSLLGIYKTPSQSNENDSNKKTLNLSGIKITEEIETEDALESIRRRSIN